MCPPVNTRGLRVPSFPCHLRYHDVLKDRAIMRCNYCYYRQFFMLPQKTSILHEAIALYIVRSTRTPPTVRHHSLLTAMRWFLIPQAA